ncbi:glycosyltransferase [Hyphomicrobium sp. D-2]|uniref:glycosyltransferase n=1 Tax=Hyphomicrobium sp. D-2 TaxID=3041621 RepID=UPI002456692A|nr:glycosyltransferase [Hyphomicrobium sp. D-2]MDH4981865.1 glycosyltransferase [Hyphomicrobium sp. D-2]
MKTISIVTPCFNEELNIRECYEVIKALFADKLPGYRREHIFCDNASTDRTAEILQEIAAADPDVKVIVNTRNFGPLRSNYNGVMASSGDAVLLCMVADLQDPPELIPQFIKHWEQGTEVVFGIRATREESWIMRNVRGAYYRLLTGVSQMGVPPGVGDFQLVDKRVVDAMRQIDDAYPFMRMMTFEIGYNAVGVPYRWVARKRGISKNSLLRLIDQGMNGLITFTSAPIRIVLFTGFFIAALAILYAVAIFAASLIMYREFAPPGIATLITAVFFFGGVQLFVTGLIGEYILAIYGQVRRKPLVFERTRLNFPTEKETTKDLSNGQR